MSRNINVKIAAIRAYKHETNCTLAEAKEAIETHGLFEAAMDKWFAETKTPEFWIKEESLSYFPLLIKTQSGKRIICYGPQNLPGGEPFTVLETNCNIEIRYTPAAYEAIASIVAARTKGGDDIPSF